MTADFGQLQFSKSLNSSPDRVFQALTSAADRMAWSPPDADSVLLIKDQPAAAPGIREMGRVGPRENPYVDVATDWVVMEQPLRLVYAETLSAEGEALATSLATFELSDSGGGTALRATIQIANFAGEEMYGEISAGWETAIDALVAHL